MNSIETPMKIPLSYVTGRHGCVCVCVYFPAEVSSNLLGVRDMLIIDRFWRRCKYNRRMCDTNLETYLISLYDTRILPLRLFSMIDY